MPCVWLGHHDGLSALIGLKIKHGILPSSQRTQQHATPSEVKPSFHSICYLPVDCTKSATPPPWEKIVSGILRVIAQQLVKS